jgi:hypothetical protein
MVRQKSRKQNKEYVGADLRLKRKRERGKPHLQSKRKVRDIFTEK